MNPKSNRQLQGQKVLSVSPPGYSKTNLNIQCPILLQRIHTYLVPERVYANLSNTKVEGKVKEMGCAKLVGYLHWSMTDLKKL